MNILQLIYKTEVNTIITIVIVLINIAIYLVLLKGEDFRPKSMLQKVTHHNVEITMYRWGVLIMTIMANLMLFSFYIIT